MKTSGKLAIIFGCIAVVGIVVAGGILFMNRVSLFTGNAGNKANLDEKRTASMEGIEDLFIETSSPNIVLHPVQGTEVTAHLHGNVIGRQNLAPVLELTESDGRMDIRVEWPGKIMVGLSAVNLTLDVYLPGDYMGSISITASSGTINAGDLTAKSVVLHTSSGSINAGSLRAAETAVRSSSGRITIGSIEADETQIVSTSGNAAVTSVKSGNYLQESTSGNIRIGNIDCPGPSVKSTSGNIAIAEGRGGINFQSSSGTVSVSLKDFTSAVTGSSTSGNVTLSLPKNSAFNLVLSTNSGRIKSDFPITTTFDAGNIQGSKKNITGSVNEGSVPVAVRTTSGNITLKTND